ncbi:hypothetical protein CW304_28010 [Bacillus sp. UFRGS-B20]|nr:hypothetical protein CW304_28010 [Bacillus sp. UFRGS-B20]
MFIFVNSRFCTEPKFSSEPFFAPEPCYNHVSKNHPFWYRFSQILNRLLYVLKWFIHRLIVFNFQIILLDVLHKKCYIEGVIELKIF